MISGKSPWTAENGEHENVFLQRRQPSVGEITDENKVPSAVISQITTYINDC